MGSGSQSMTGLGRSARTAGRSPVTSMRAARPSPAPTRGTRPLATGSAWRRDTLPPQRFLKGPHDRARPRLARPLRQMHDLRDVLSVLASDAALSGPEVRWAPGGAVPRRRGLGGRIGRLLLGLWDLYAGLPPGSEDRGTQLSGS